MSRGPRSKPLVFQARAEAARPIRTPEEFAPAVVAAGLSPVRLSTAETACAAASEVRSEKLSPFEALRGVLARGSRIYAEDVQGWVAELASLDALEFPPDVLTRPRLDLAMGVTHHRPPGAAWGQLMVFVVFLAPAQA